MTNRDLCRLCLVLALAVAVAYPTLAQELPPAGWIADQTAQGYRSAARYPAHARPLGVGAEDPIVAERTPSRITVAPEGASGAALTVWPARIAFTDGRPIDLFAELHDARGRAISGAIAGEVADASGRLVGEARFFDDGVAPDTTAGDGRFSARVSLSPSLTTARATSYLVRITATADGARGPLHATTGFQISRPGATLTGRFQDRAASGNLVVGAEARVRTAGRYHLSATVATLDGTPIGTAQTAVRLTPGQHWIELDFFGLMFHDRGSAGPFVISSITLADASTMPNALGEVLRDRHVTHAYPLARFADRPFEDPALLGAARRLEAEASRARGER